jgi:glycosyltransferase involved in cell wall biosynthesis
MVAYRHAKVLQEWGQDVRIFCGRFGDVATQPYQIEVEKGEFYVTRVSLSPRDLSGDIWHYDNHQIMRAFAKTVDQFSPNVVHFRYLMGLSVKMIDECHRRGIPTVLTLHDHGGICFKSLMLKNDGTVCTHGGFDCLDCKETLTEALAIPSPIRNAHILLSLRKVDRLIAASECLAAMYAANGIPRAQIAVLRNGIDVANFQRSRQEHEVLTLGFIGFLGKHKALYVLLYALALLGDLDADHHREDKDMVITWELLLAVLGVLSAGAMALLIFWQ